MTTGCPFRRARTTGWSRRERRGSCCAAVAPRAAHGWAGAERTGGPEGPADMDGSVVAVGEADWLCVGFVFLLCRFIVLVFASVARARTLCTASCSRLLRLLLPGWLVVLVPGLATIAMTSGCVKLRKNGRARRPSWLSVHGPHPLVCLLPHTCERTQSLWCTLLVRSACLPACL